MTPTHMLTTTLGQGRTPTHMLTTTLGQGMIPTHMLTTTLDQGMTPTHMLTTTLGQGMTPTLGLGTTPTLHKWISVTTQFEHKSKLRRRVLMGSSTLSLHCYNKKLVE